MRRYDIRCSVLLEHVKKVLTRMWRSASQTAEGFILRFEEAFVHLFWHNGSTTARLQQIALHIEEQRVTLGALVAPKCVCSPLLLITPLTGESDESVA